MDLHVLTGQLPHRNPKEFLHPGQCLHSTGHQKEHYYWVIFRGWECLFACDAYISVADDILVVEDHVARAAEATQAGSHGALGVPDARNQS